MPLTPEEIERINGEQRPLMPSEWQRLREETYPETFDSPPVEPEDGGLTPEERKELIDLRRLDYLEKKYGAEQPQYETLGAAIKGGIQRGVEQWGQPQEPRGGILGGIETFGKQIPRGLTFGFSEELARPIQAGMLAIGGAEEPWAEAGRLTEAREQERRALAEANPISGFLGELAPAVMTGTVGAKALARGAQKFVPRLAQAGQQLTTTLLGRTAARAGIGGTAGGLYGAGTEEGGLEERAREAKRMAEFSAIGGVAFPAATAIAGKTVVPLFGKYIGQPISRRVRPMAAKAAEVINKKRGIAPPPLPKGDPADIAAGLIKETEIKPVDGDGKSYEKVRKALTQDFGKNYHVALDAFKRGDMSLAELHGKRTESLAIGAAQYSGGKAKAVEFFEPKTLESGDRLIKSIGVNISDVDNYHTSIDDVVKKGRIKANPKYEKAYDADFEITPLIDDYLNRPAGLQAMKKAKVLSENEGKEFLDGGFESYDSIKRGFDDLLEGYRDTTTGKLVLNAEGRSINSLRFDYLNELKRINPLYSDALESGGDYLTISNAMDRGRKALLGDYELSIKTFKELPEREQEAYKIGLGKAMRDKINVAGEGVNPYNAVFGKPKQKQLLSSILSPAQYKGLERSLNAENRLFKMRNNVIGGSPTAEKTEAKNLIASMPAVDVYTLSAKIMTDALMRAKGKIFDGLNDKTASKVSEILYETNPIRKLEILDRLGASRHFTREEKDLVKKAYFVAAEKYDIVKSSTIGGLIPPITSDFGEQ